MKSPYRIQDIKGFKYEKDIVLVIMGGTINTKKDKLMVRGNGKAKISIFRDPIYKDMEFSIDIVKLIDTPQMQRLRGVLQLGLVSWVFVGATHTRFQHSLGTMHIGGRIIKNLIQRGSKGIDNEDCMEMIMVGCLFHDVGVPAFSHTLYDHGILGEKDNHELKSAIIAKNVIKSIQSNFSFTGEDIYNLIYPIKNTVETDIISGTIDADRIDYLNRDSLYTGVSYGSIDDRIILELKVDDGRLILKEKGVPPAISLLFARTSMKENVYDHRTSRILGGLISRGVWRTIRDKRINKKDLFGMNDAELLSILRGEKEAKGYVSAIENRAFPKLAKTWSLREVADHIRDLQMIRENMEKRLEIERELAKKIGVDGNQVYLDIPDLNRYTINEANIPVGKSNGKKLKEYPLAKSIGEAYSNLFSIRLYVPKDRIKIASNKFNSVYDLN